MMIEPSNTIVDIEKQKDDPASIFRRQTTADNKQNSRTETSQEIPIGI
jgi:hypothetical protein